jgi:hypothetical protein
LDLAGEYGFCCISKKEEAQMNQTDRDGQQNIATEVLASFAMIGGTQVDYRSTPLGSTEMARRSDPLCNDLTRDGWWEHGLDPRDDDGREVLALLDRAKARYVRDGREEQTYVANDDQNSYLPAPDEEFQSWLGRIAKDVDVNSPNKRSLFDVLSAYVAKFPSTKFADLSEQSKKTLATLVQHLCAEAA